MPTARARKGSSTSGRQTKSRGIWARKRPQRFCYVYDVTPEGNFEGKNILNLPKTIEQCAAAKGWDLAELTERIGRLPVPNCWRCAIDRVRPGKDDKILVSWNGLMIDAMAKAAGILHEPRYLDAATVAATIYPAVDAPDDGRLLHTYRGGHAKQCGFLDDYACLIDGLVVAVRSQRRRTWIDEALCPGDRSSNNISAMKRAVRSFSLPDDHEPLIARHKGLARQCGSSGTPNWRRALMRMGKLCGRADTWSPWLVRLWNPPLA